MDGDSRGTTQESEGTGLKGLRQDTYGETVLYEARTLPDPWETTRRGRESRDGNRRRREGEGVLVVPTRVPDTGGYHHRDRLFPNNHNYWS